MGSRRRRADRIARRTPAGVMTAPPNLIDELHELIVGLGAVDLH
jgi:hypothetical protein